MSLRKMLPLILALFAFVLLTTAGTLAALTTALHRGSLEIGSSIETVRLGEETLLELVHREQMRDPADKAIEEARVRWRLDQARAFVTTERGARALSNAVATVTRHLDLTRDAASAQGAGQPPPSLAEAFLALEALTAVNREDARRAQEQAGFWDRMGRLGGATAVVLLVLVGVLAFFWLRSALVRPVLAVEVALRRHMGGDPHARVVEAGAAEMRTLAHCFNDMCSRQKKQRENELAFVAGVAHDLRTPLAILRLSVRAGQRAAQAGAPEAQAQALERIDRQVDRLERILGDVLESSRIEAGYLELRAEPVDLRTLLAEARELFDQATTRHRFELALPDQPVIVRCDPLRVGQVLSNLVGNAVKYSPDGGLVRLELAASPGRALLTVADEGSGIPEADRAHIFEPFRRTVTDGRIPGTGLGLFVVMRIVKAHGGSVEVRSREGGGTEFAVSLPM